MHPIPLLSVEDLDSPEYLAAGRIVVALTHVRAVQGMTLFRLDVFALSKQQAIQLPFVLENLPFNSPRKRA